MPDVSNRTITFLCTDIEGSTRLWEDHPAAMSAALTQHDSLLRSFLESHEGCVFKTVGDAFCAAFTDTGQALRAAAEIQRWLPPLQVAAGEGTLGLKVRMALHTGFAEYRGGDYFGPTLNHAERILAAGHGGQVLLSGPVADALHDAPPPEVELRSLGERRLRGIPQPERLYQLVAPGLATSFPPLRTLVPRRTNLPAPTTSFVGREREVAEVADLLRDPSVRLVTLTGPGGTGKTRLSLQAAAELLDDFEDGTWFVPLAAVSEPEMVMPAVARALSLPENGERSAAELLAENLREKQALLVLDHFEQVVEAAPYMSQLLRSAPRLKVLVSSSEWLNLYGEHDYEVPKLSFPDPDRLPPPAELARCEAVALFQERARAHRPSFALTCENSRAVVEVCARLGGMPLALELAAARVRQMGMEEIKTGLADRLGLLPGGARDLAARQQSVRGAIDWSYALLAAEEQEVFAALSVFAGGCTVTAAAAVCEVGGPEMRDGLLSLCGKSMLSREVAGGEERFLMLEPLREFGLQCLLESNHPDGPPAQHARYFLGLAQEAELHLYGEAQIPWLDRLAREQGNICAALQWALTASPEIALRLAKVVRRSWELRCYAHDGREWLDRALHLKAGVLHTRPAS